MENASRALLMAGGILLGVLILTLMVTLFISAREMSSGYDDQKQSEAVQKFNVNFTKYIGRNLTIHDVVTICNFAKENNVTVSPNNTFTINNETLKKTYQLTILDYNPDGYVSKILITTK